MSFARPITYTTKCQETARLCGEENFVCRGESCHHHTIKTGFIAQEVAAAANSLNYTFNGVEVPHDPEQPYYLNVNLLVAPLVKAVQEQQITITALRATDEQQQVTIKFLQDTVDKQQLLLKKLCRIVVAQSGDAAILDKY